MKRELRCAIVDYGPDTSPLPNSFFTVVVKTQEPETRATRRRLVRAMPADENVLIVRAFDILGWKQNGGFTLTRTGAQE